MDTRLLYSIALIIAVVSGALYYYSGKSAHLAADNKQNLSYTATQVSMLQTDAQGALASKTSAQQLQYWIETAESELTALDATWYQNNQPYATFTADKAVGRDNNTVITLMDNITATRLATQDQPLIRFNTTRLTGYPKEHRIETKAPIKIQSPTGQFTSQGLHANLLEGQYNFFNIRGHYASARGQ